MIPHDATDSKVLKSMPCLVQVVCKHARLQPVLAVVHPACRWQETQPESLQDSAQLQDSRQLPLDL